MDGPHPAAAMAWVDLETTGLPESVSDEAILELGILVTDRFGVELASYQSLVLDFQTVGKMSRMNEFVASMHDRSGLAGELMFMDDKIRLGLDENEDMLFPANVAKDAIAWLDEIVGPRTDDDRFPMAGSTINFDRAFLAHHMRELHDWFHYRNIDVSSIMNLVRMHRPDLYLHGEKAFADTVKKHRVLDDLRDSVAWYRFYLDNFLKL